MSNCISVITPSFERQNFLQSLYYTILQQQFSGKWEWLIFDMSTYPSSFFCSLADERIRYWHSEEKMSIGNARNLLKERAQGNLIVHFDDDDYYAPSYFETVEKSLADHDFFKISSWFNYDVKTHQFYYWDTEEIIDAHFVLDPFTGNRIREIELGAPLKDKCNLSLRENGAKGYGFSYAYRRNVADACAFPDIDFKEDTHFYEEALKKGFSIHQKPDREGIVIKMIHDNNISCVFPQYRIPSFVAHRLFPKFSDFLSQYPYESTI